MLQGLQGWRIHILGADVRLPGMLRSGCWFIGKQILFFSFTWSWILSSYPNSSSCVTPWSPCAPRALEQDWGGNSFFLPLGKRQILFPEFIHLEHFSAGKHSSVEADFFSLEMLFGMNFATRNIKILPFELQHGFSNEKTYLLSVWFSRHLLFFL